MRVISGGGGKEKEFAFQTNWATVIPLGTAFDLTVTPSGVTKVLLLEGQVTLCGKNQGDNCKTVATPCAVLQVAPGEDVEEIKAGKPRVQEIRDHFPLAKPQASLLEPFQIVDPGCAKGGIGPRPIAGSAIPVETVAIGVGIGVAIIICIALCDSPKDSNNNTNN